MRFGYFSDLTLSSPTRRKLGAAYHDSECQKPPLRIFAQEGEQGGERNSSQIINPSDLQIFLCHFSGMKLGGVS